jgi:hypothetical protein
MQLPFLVSLAVLSVTGTAYRPYSLELIYDSEGRGRGSSEVIIWYLY